MGNMLPCLVQGSSGILPPMNTKHWSRSIKFLVRTLRRSTKRPHCSNRAKAAASRETSAADQATPRTRSRGPNRSGQNRRAVRVKVVLTRAEAAQLLSLTAHGHRTAAQVVSELKRMQQATSSCNSKASTARVINELKGMEELVARANTSASASTAWRPVLESIPEEWQ